MAKSHSVRHQGGFTFIALSCFLLLYLPMMTMVVFAFNSGSTVGELEGLSLRWFSAAWENERVIEALLRSLLVATIAGLISTAVATMAAIATTRTAPYRGMGLKVALINQPLVVPEIVTAVALLIVFSQIKVFTGYTGLGYMVAAHTAFCVPFAFLPIRARLQTMDLTLERAAADLYARPRAVFWRITLPLLWPGILAGFMLAFVVSLDDVVISEFIKSAGQETLPTYMLGQLRRTITPEINAISTVFLGVSIAVVSVFFLLTRNKS